MTVSVMKAQVTGESAGSGRPTILIVGQYQLIAESLAFALQVDGFQVQVALATTGPALGDALQAKWNVVLLNVDLETHDDVARYFALLAGAGPVVVLTTGTNQLAQAWCIEAGAAALADKEQPLEQLLDIVRRVVGGETLLESSERESLIKMSRRHSNEVLRRRAPFRALTAREQQVLSHLLEGQSVRAIARMSAVSESTVRSQIRSIFRKLGVNSQLRAVSLARQVGWTASLPQ